MSILMNLWVEIYQGCADIPPRQRRLPHHPHSNFTCRFSCVRFQKHHVPKVPERGKRDDFAPWIGFVTTLRQVHGPTKSVLRGVERVIALCTQTILLGPRKQNGPNINPVHSWVTGGSTVETLNQSFRGSSSLSQVQDSRRGSIPKEIPRLRTRITRADYTY